MHADNKHVQVSAVRVRGVDEHEATIHNGSYGTICFIFF